MLSKKTIATSIKGLEVLEKRVKAHVEHNEAQCKVYEEQLKTKGAIVTLSAGFKVKEEFLQDNATRSLKLHTEEVLKNKPLLEEYQNALAELRSL